MSCGPDPHGEVTLYSMSADGPKREEVRTSLVEVSGLMKPPELRADSPGREDVIMVPLKHGSGRGYHASENKK